MAIFDRNTRPPTCTSCEHLAHPGTPCTMCGPLFCLDSESRPAAERASGGELHEILITATWATCAWFCAFVSVALGTVGAVMAAGHIWPFLFAVFAGLVLFNTFRDAAIGFTSETWLLARLAWKQRQQRMQAIKENQARLDAEIELAMKRHPADRQLEPAGDALDAEYQRLCDEHRAGEK